MDEYHLHQPSGCRRTKCTSTFDEGHLPNQANALLFGLEKNSMTAPRVTWDGSIHVITYAVDVGIFFVYGGDVRY